MNYYYCDCYMCEEEIEDEMKDDEKDEITFSFGDPYLFLLNILENGPIEDLKPIANTDEKEMTKQEFMDFIMGPLDKDATN